MERRAFFATAGAISTGLAGSAAHAQSPSTVRPRVELPAQIRWTIFSRHLQWLTTQAYAHANPFETGVLIGNKAQEIGFRHVDLTVRSTGHVDPNLCDVRVNLPLMLAGVRSTGALCNHITANIETADASIGSFNGNAVMPETLLQICRDQGVKYYRWGGFSYNVQPDANGNPQPFGNQVLEQLRAFSMRLKSLARLNQIYGVTAIYHTSSGGNGPRSVWDLMHLLSTAQPEQLAINFDIGHMVRESALSAWRTNVRYAMPYIRGVGLKDGAVVRNTNGTIGGSFPLAGTGMVQWREFFQLLLQGNFNGPAEAQYEYNVDGRNGTSVSLNTTFWADHAQFQSGNLTPLFMTEELRKDITYYRAQAALAGWTSANAI